mgnify:CR=1 FL=1
MPNFVNPHRKVIRMVKVKIDKDLCTSCSVCANLCPDVFMMGDDGKSSIVEKFRGASDAEGDIPAELLDCARAAADSCPAQAITIEE